MDSLKRSDFLKGLTGNIHLTQYDALASINPDLARSTAVAAREAGLPQLGSVTQPQWRKG